MANTTDISMRILLSATSGNSLSVIQSVTSSLGTSGLQGALLGVGAAATALAVGFGVASVKAAGDFQATMLKVQALANVSKEQSAQASDAILRMASTVGQTPQLLADGLYYIASAGFDAKDSLMILEASAKAASVGMTSTETVANAVTASMKALNIPASQTNRILDEMTKTVSTGKTEWDDYARVVGKLALNASQAKVSFEETNSAFAILTNTMPSSRQAADSLNALLQTSSRFDLLESRAKSLGLAFDTDKYKTLDFEGRLKYLQEITGGNTEEIGKLLGRQNALAALTALSTNKFKDYNAALNDIKHSGGAADEAFQKTSSGFNASTQRLGAAFEAVKIRVGTALLPMLTNLMNFITPLLQGFLDWENRTHGIENAVGAATNVIGGFVSGVTRVVQFFQNNQMAMDALKAGLIGFAVAVAVAVVPSFIAWAVSAGAAAVATLAAAAPFILIGVVVAAVVLGIILAIRNWGAITAWFSGIWSAFVSWLMGVLGAIGQFFVNIWNGILFGVRAAWGAITGAVRSALAFLVGIFTAPFRAIGALFTWLYNHNYYFKALIDSIRMIVAAGLVLVSSLWQAGINFVVGLWNGLVGRATAIWNLVTGAVRVAVSAAWAALVAVWTFASNWVQGQWNRYAGMAQSAWSAVSGVFSGVWNNYISKPLNNLWNGISNWFNDLKNKALNFGGSFIQSIANGISGAGGVVGNAIHNAIKAGLDALGFHDIPGFAGGVQNFGGGLAIVGERGPELMYIPPGASIYPNNALNMLFSPQGVRVSPSAAPLQGGRQQPQYITVINMPPITVNGAIGDKRQLSDWLVKEISSRLRRSGVFTTMTSGGKAVF